MKVFELFETNVLPFFLFEQQYILNVDTSNPKRRFITVDPSVVARSKEWYSSGLSDIGVQLLKSGKIKEGDGLIWTLGDNIFSGVIKADTSNSGYLNGMDNDWVDGKPYYSVNSHQVKKLEDAHTRRSDQHLNDILDVLAYGQQLPQDMEYIKQFYPECYTSSPVNMYRVLEIPVVSLYKAKIKSSDELTNYIMQFKSGYMSWSLKREGIDYFRYYNTGARAKNNEGGTPHNILNTKKDISTMPVLVILKQQNNGINIIKLLDTIKKTPAHIHTGYGLSRKSQMGEAHEILSPINTKTVEILSIQVPYKNEQSEIKIANLSPDEITKVYEIRKAMGTQGYWDPKETKIAHSWDTSSIPESLINFLKVA